MAHKRNKTHMLRSLDLSYNNISSAGFLKLLSRLKKSTALTNLNVSGNDLGDTSERFVNLEKFLSRNESCKTLNLSDCRLQLATFAQMGLGLTKNITLERLILASNDIADREALNHIVKGLLENTEGSVLSELDVSKNRITSDCIAPFVDLFEQNFKIRTINLRHNVVTDEGAQLLVQAIGNNEYITKLQLDMNPLRISLLNDLEKHTSANLQKVNQQEVPQMVEEILDVKKKTAQALFDCAEDPMIRDKISVMMNPNRLKNLKRANSRGGSFHRRTIGPVPKRDQDQLLKNHFFDSTDVVAITDEIQTQLKSIAIDKQQTFELYQENETMKEKMMEEDKAKIAELKAETSRLQDVKREMEFEIMMLEEAAKTEQAREKQRRADVEHKIETLKLNQEKIKD